MLGDRLLFSTAGLGSSLWETDGTQAGTVRLRSLATNGAGRPWRLFKAGGALLVGFVSSFVGASIGLAVAGDDDDDQHELARRGVLHASFGGRLYTPTEGEVEGGDRTNGPNFDVRRASTERAARTARQTGA